MGQERKRAVADMEKLVEYEGREKSQVYRQGDGQLGEAVLQDADGRTSTEAAAAEAGTVIALIDPRCETSKESKRSLQS